MQTVLYSKYEHGGYPVEILPESGFRVQTPKGAKTLPSKRQLMIFLQGKDLHMPFDRYFRIGRYEPVLPVPVETILDLFQEPDPCPTILIKRGCGIDLAKRGHEVAKLIFKGYGKRILQDGLEPEDVLQEVYKGILIRNQGKGAYDPDRSSFSHYVYLVGRCVLANLQRASKKKVIHENPGIRVLKDGGLQEGDVGEGQLLQVEQDIDFMLDDCNTWLDQRKRNPHAQLAKDILPLLYEGRKRKDIAEILDLRVSQVSQAIRFLRSQIPEWVLH